MRLVLVGGGHSHALVINHWTQNSPFELTLISENFTTPYSGMVPGYIAGFHDRSACFIDLQKLCHRSGVNFVQGTVTGLDLEHNLLTTTDRSLSFDRVSLNIGGSPIVPNFMDNSRVIRVKPMGQFLDRWDKIKQANRQSTIAIVGGGAGGVELAFAVKSGLPQSQIYLLHQGPSLLPQHNKWVQQKALQKLENHGVKVYLDSGVVQINDQVITRSGLQLSYDFVFWVTQSGGASWLRSSGLALDDRAFVLVDDYLRSVSNSQVFAAGDVATMTNFSVPKAGVFAVRQGLALYHNLQRSLRGQPLKAYHPQLNYLSLIGTGDGKAIGSWGNWGAEGRWLWYLKDYIDRGFMAQFV